MSLSGLVSRSLFWPVVERMTCAPSAGTYALTPAGYSTRTQSCVVPTTLSVWPMRRVATGYATLPTRHMRSAGSAATVTKDSGWLACGGVVGDCG